MHIILVKDAHVIPFNVKDGEHDRPAAKYSHIPNVWLWANFKSIYYTGISEFFLFLNFCSQCSHETCKAWVKVFIIFMCMIFVFFLRCLCSLFCYVTRHADIIIRITLFPIVYIRVTSPTVTSRVNEAIVHYQKKLSTMSFMRYHGWYKRYYFFWESYWYWKWS